MTSNPSHSGSEKPPIFVSRTGGFLRGASPLDEELIRELPALKTLRATFVQPRRSSQQLRLYRALLKVVCDNLDQPLHPDALHGWLKLKLGYVHPVRLRSGAIIEIPASVAFDKMDHATFTAFFSAAKDLIVRDIIPGLNSAALEREAFAMLGVAA